MISLDEFIQKYKGKTVCYPEGKYCGQCLSLVKIYIKEVFGIDPPASGCNGARCYWSIFPSPLDSIFEKVPNRPDLVPKRGWVAVWDGSVGGGAGHIAIVADDKATKSTFNSFDSNWGSKTAQIVTHNYNNVYGFLVPKGNNMSEYDEAIRKAVAYDEVCGVLKQPTTTSKEETVKKLSEIISDKERYQTERDNYAEEIKEKDNQITTLKKDIADLNDELENCVAEIPGQEDLEKDYEITGRKIIRQVGDTTVETTYKVKG